MKVMLLNGSPHANGCTFTALTEVAGALEREGVGTELVQLGNGPLRDCIGCGKCRELDCACVFDDDAINGILQKAREADGFIFGTPVYYAHPTGRVQSALDRLFYAGSGKAFAWKPGAAVASARRAGTTGSIDVINKYFTIARMPVVSSSYWNGVHGNTPAEVRQDLEGMQTLRNLGRNMAWLLRCIACGKDHGVLPPETETGTRTNFIR